MFSDAAVEGRNKRQRSLSERVSERERGFEDGGERDVGCGRKRESEREMPALVGTESLQRCEAKRDKLRN